MVLKDRCDVENGDGSRFPEMQGTAEVDFYRRIESAVRSAADPFTSFAGFAPYVPNYMGTIRVDAAGGGSSPLIPSRPATVT